VTSAITQGPTECSDPWVSPTPHGTEGTVTDDQAIVQVEWRPLTADDLSLGAVTVEHADGTRPNTAT